MRRVAATAGRAREGGRTGAFRMYLALAKAGFRRYATYRQALVAAMFTNSVFGFLRCYVLIGAATGVGGALAGYSRPQLLTYVWAGQGLIGTVLLWAPPDLAERIRTGQVLSDLLRPVDPVWQEVAGDLGRAGYGALTRFVGPLAVGALFFDLYAPRHWYTYPAFACSTLVATILCCGCRYLVNSCAFWLLDARGPAVAWILFSSLFAGLNFPLWILPEPLAVILVVGTPFPSLMQLPMDVLVERHPAAWILPLQVAWAVVVLATCRAVQRRAERRLVIQGG